MEATAQIHLGKNTGLTHVVQALVNSGHRIHHILLDVVQPPIINAHPFRTIVLLRKQNAGTESRVRRLDPAMVHVFIQLTTQLHFFRRTIHVNTMAGR